MMVRGLAVGVIVAAALLPIGAQARSAYDGSWSVADKAAAAGAALTNSRCRL